MVTVGYAFSDLDMSERNGQESSKGSHAEGLRLFQSGRAQDSVALFDQALREQETSERWNDWAAALHQCGDSAQAERGFRRALDLDPSNLQAAANLGALLAQSSRPAEAISFLARSLSGVGAAERSAVESLLRQCHNSLAEQEEKKARDLIYFLHIPKTSGASFHGFLVDVFGEAYVSPRILIWDDLPEFSDVSKQWKVFVGHFGGFLPFMLPSWPRIVTLLRNPVHRTISHINHVQRDARHPLHRYAKHLTVPEYCRHPKLRHTVENYQARYLASLSFTHAILKIDRDVVRAPREEAFDNALYALDRQDGLLESALAALSAIDMVGITEWHQQAKRLFTSKFAISCPVPEAKWLNKAGDSQMRCQDLPAEDLAAIQSITEVDQLVYECATQMFRAECSRSGIGIEDPR
jgi:tetratricopeptide (TPR) repeat protein